MNNYYMNCKEARFIYHGEWADAEVYYHGKLINESDATESIWNIYCEEAKEKGEKPTEKGFDLWLEEQSEALIYGVLEDMIYATECN